MAVLADCSVARLFAPEARQNFVPVVAEPIVPARPVMANGDYRFDMICVHLPLGQQLLALRAFV